MATVVLAGLGLDLTERVKEQLSPLATILLAASGDAALAQLAQGHAELLVVDDRIEQPPVADLLAQIRGREEMSTLPVLLLANSRQNLPDPGLGQIMFAPVESRALVQQIVRLARLGPVAGPGAALASAVLSAWGRFKSTSLKRLDHLEVAVADLARKRLAPEQARGAEREAHKLAGSLGMFGFPRASQLAGALEARFSRPSELDQEVVGRMALRVASLRVELERGPAAGARGEKSEKPAQAAAQVLFLVQDGELGDRVSLQADAQGLAVSPATSLAEAMSQLGAGLRPMVAALDLLALQPPEEAFNLIRQLNQLDPPANVVLWGDPRDQGDRLMAARWGIHSIIGKQRGVERLVDELVKAYKAQLAARGRVLAVDDDPVVLEMLHSVLERGGFQVSTLSDPLAFWKTLESVRPDLLILDQDMPQVSGIELCRVVRGDERWAALPVVFLTGSKDPGVVERVFAAGADDFVSKPVNARELRARLSNRLRRATTQRLRGQEDSVTGAKTRETGLDSLDQLLRLSLRQSQPMSVALVSLDEPTQAHQQQLAGLLNRPSDLLVLWDDASFLTGLFGIGREEAVERLAQGLEAFRQETGSTFRAVVASCPADGTDSGSLLEMLELGLNRLRPNRVVPVQRALAEAQTSHDVVLVEDDVDMAALIMEALQTRGLEALHLADGAEAMRRLQSELKPRLVLLDLDLPGADGFAILSSLDLEKVRVIVVSRNKQDATILRCTESGASDFIGKPFSLSVLLQRVQRALGD